MKDYSDLPEYMSSLDISNEINQVLTIANSTENVSDEEIANALMELVFRQNNTRESFDKRLVEKIEQWVVKSWTNNSKALADVLCTIAANLDTTTLRKMLDKAKQTAPSEIKEMIEETLQEMPNSLKEDI
jgi:hypothetical protein